jgi:tetratricopeptide (TPR) repeat protein
MIGFLLLAASTLPTAHDPIAAMAQTRDLLRARKHAVLTSRVEDQQRAAATSSLKADELDWSLNAFRVEDTEIAALIDEWVAASPKSWAPLLARALNKGARARAARGEKWASETSADQFRRMGVLQAGMNSDCRKVLSLDRAVCPCYVELVLASRAGVLEVDPLVEQAFQECARDYTLHVERVFALTPRWGGSYEQMSAAIESARRGGLPEASLKNLASYLPADRASVLQLDRRLQEARAVLDQAIKDSPTPLLLEERAELNQKLGDAAGVLRDANAALEETRGGWMFSRGRLSRLLCARAWALFSTGRKEEALGDVAAALEITPTDPHVVNLHQFLQKAAGAEKR